MRKDGSRGPGRDAQPMTDDTRGLIRQRDQAKRVSLQELFFDLAFVAALAEISRHLAGTVTATGTLQALLTLAAIWWIWAVSAALTDVYDPERRPIQLVLFGTTIGVVLLAVASPAALGDRGLIFGATNVAVHIGRGLVLVGSLRGRKVQGRAARYLFWFGLSAPPWLIGSLVSDTWIRVALWLLALTLDFVAYGLRYPSPWVGRLPHSHYDRAGTHLGERYQQVMTIALGDLVLVPTLEFSHTDFTAARVVAFLTTFAKTLLLWQIYVSRAGSVIQAVNDRSPSRVVRWAPYTHLIMIAGVVAMASASEIVINRPTGTDPPSWIALMYAGPVLFLIGRAAFEYEVFEQISWSRVAFLPVLAGAAAGTASLPPLCAEIVLTLILLGVAVADAARTRQAQQRGHQHEIS
jgi:low temperature requirement protein LtrA